MAKKKAQIINHRLATVRSRGIQIPGFCFYVTTAPGLLPRFTFKLLFLSVGTGAWNGRLYLKLFGVVIRR